MRHSEHVRLEQKRRRFTDEVTCRIYKNERDRMFYAVYRLRSRILKVHDHTSDIIK